VENKASLKDSLLLKLISPPYKILPYPLFLASQVTEKTIRILTTDLKMLIAVP
jgi:hypothetical protein